MTLEGHSLFVEAANFSPNNDYVVTGSADETAIIWELSTGKMLKRLEGHSGIVFAANFSPNNDYVVTGSKDKKAIIWELGTGKILKTLEGHSDTVKAANFSPNNDYVVTGSFDEKAIIWKVSTGKMLKTLEGHSEGVMAANFSPNNDYVVTGSCDWTAKVWELSTGKILKTLEGHLDCVMAASFSPNNVYVVTGSEDYKAMIWEVERGCIIKVLGAASLQDRATTPAALACLFVQVFSSAFKKSLPWNHVVADKFCYIRCFAMLDLDRFDFKGSHDLAVTLKFGLFGVLALEVMAVSYRQRLTFLEERCPKLKNILIWVATQFLYLPMATCFMEMMSQSWVDRQLSADHMLRQLEVARSLTASCLLVSLTVAVFPYLCVAGDLSLIPQTDLFNPKKWSRHIEEKQSRIDIGLFKASLNPSTADTMLTPTFLATTSELLLKVTVASSNILTPYAGVTCCTFALVQRVFIQLYRPQYYYKEANYALKLAKLMSLWPYCLGLLVLSIDAFECSHNEGCSHRMLDTSKGPLWPLVLLAGGIIIALMHAVRQFQVFEQEKIKSSSSGDLCCRDSWAHQVSIANGALQRKCRIARESL